MVNRIQPAGPPEWFQTYRVSAPKSTHWRKATCAEVGCLAYLRGWKSRIDVGTDLGRRQAHFIMNNSGRKYKLEKTGPTMYEFVFEAGQSCFERSEHKVRLDMPERFALFPGDWRAHGELVTFNNYADWLDHFAEHQDKINTRNSRYN